MLNTVETVVIGAGCSGLTYAHERLKRDPDASLCVLEGADQPGGLMRTVQVTDPLPIAYEAGPEAISDPSGRVRALVQDLGLEIVQATDTKRFLVHGGQLVEAPSSPGAFLRSPVLPLRARMRAAREPFCDPRIALDGSIADFVRHRLGRHVLETLVDPLVAGIHAGTPEQLSLRACFPALAEGVAQHGSISAYLKSRAGKTPAEDRLPWKPARGMGGLSAALAERLGDRLHLGQRVTGLNRTGDESSWEARTEQGVLQAQRVVLALPVQAAAQVLQAALPAVSRTLAEIQCESLMVVAHAYRRKDVRHALDGFGYLVAAQTGLAHLGTLFSSTLDPRAIGTEHVLLRTMLKGPRSRPAPNATDQEVLALVREEVGPLLGLGGDPVFAAVCRHEHTLPRYDLDHPARLMRMQGDLPGDLHLLGNHQRGVGLSALVKDAAELADSHAS